MLQWVIPIVISEVHTVCRNTGVKDYIKNPKPNGYRSLHLLIEVPVFLTDRMEKVVIEVQIRTIAMDFWASVEHKLKYKKDVKDTEEIVRQLKLCADSIEALDYRMQEIRDQIDEGMD